MVRGYAGSYTYAKYGWELVDYATSAADVCIPFGHDVKISSWGRKNNQETLYSLGINEARSQITKAFEGSFSAEFVLGNGYWLKALVGNSATTSGASAPFTHKYVDLDNEVYTSKHPASFTTEIGFDDGTGSAGETYSLLGCLATSAKISFASNEPCRVTLDCVYSDESLAATYDQDEAEDSFDTISEPVAYQNVKIFLPDTVELTVIENCDITINNNAEAVVTLGSRKARVPLGKHMEYDVSISAYFADDVSNGTSPVTALNNFIQRFYDGEESSTATAPLDEGNVDECDIKIVLSNEYANTEKEYREITLEFAGCTIDAIDCNLDTKEAIKLDMTLKVRRINLLTVMDGTAGAAKYGTGSS